ncbi:bifunctional metallophosphatase/5'-nucleotidase [Chitinimonas koreensis]|nr:bifunctional metallophosphatase/5'-nucleotidase [Chitinimonas koreensis]
MRHLPALAAVLLLAACATAPKPSGPVELRILAFNDFHGHLETPAGGVPVPDPARPGQLVTVPAGGSPYLATWLDTLRAGARHSITVSAGDLIGASPLLSALFHDEPTIRAMNQMGLDLNAVGNHEFDEGRAELLRMQAGGCHPVDGCRFDTRFEGARFRFLAANVVDAASGETLFPAYAVREYEGIKVAFIGMTLKGTPSIVTPAGVAGLRFDDEVDTVNRLVPRLRAEGIEAIVVLLHEGGKQRGRYDQCEGISGPIVDIVKRLDRAVDLVISGHTHQAYTCLIDGRPVSSARQYGQVVSEIDLRLDRASRDVAAVRLNNVVVRTDVAPKADQLALIAQAKAQVAPLAERVVGRIAAPITRQLSPGGDAALGSLVADAQLQATRGAGAQIAFANGGGLRADLASQDGVLRYVQLFTVQPFGNRLITLTLSGAQIVALLESQWQGERFNPLQVSAGFRYAWHAGRPPGRRIDPAEVTLDGVPLRLDGRYRVTVNDFLASGGDGFTVLREGREPVAGLLDIEALEAHVQAQDTLRPPALGRIERRED